MWKFILVILTFVALGWVGIFAGIYLIWHLNRLERNTDEQIKKFRLSKMQQMASRV